MSLLKVRLADPQAKSILISSFNNIWKAHGIPDLPDVHYIHQSSLSTTQFGVEMPVQIQLQQRDKYYGCWFTLLPCCSKYCINTWLFVTSHREFIWQMKR